MALKKGKQNRPILNKDNLRNSNLRISLKTNDYYYVWGKTNTGRNYIDGPYYTEKEAWEGGYQAIDGDFKVIKLGTSDLRTATRIIKRMDLEETRSIEQSLRKARHQL